MALRRILVRRATVLQLRTEITEALADGFYLAEVISKRIGVVEASVKDIMLLIASTLDTHKAGGEAEDHTLQLELPGRISHLQGVLDSCTAQTQEMKNWDAVKTFLDLNIEIMQSFKAARGSDGDKKTDAERSTIDAITKRTSTLLYQLHEALLDFNRFLSDFASVVDVVLTNSVHSFFMTLAEVGVNGSLSGFARNTIYGRGTSAITSCLLVSQLFELYAYVYGKHIREGIERVSVLSNKALRNVELGPSAQEFNAWADAAQSGTKVVRREQQSRLTQKLRDSVRDVEVAFEGLLVSPGPSTAASGSVLVVARPANVEIDNASA